MIALEQGFGLLDRLQGCTECRALREAELEEQFGPLRQWKELLLYVAKAHNRKHKDAGSRQHHHQAPLDAPFDHPAQCAISPGLVDRVRIVFRTAPSETAEQLHADIRGEK